MNVNRFVFAARIVLTSTALILGSPTSPAQQPQKQQIARHTLDLTVVKPETVGFSSERLERLHALMQQVVDKKQTPESSPSLPATAR
jgi:hypothetical protein